MTASTGEQGEGDDDRVIALTPTQIGFALAIVIVLIYWLRARRRRTV